MEKYIGFFMFVFIIAALMGVIEEGTSGFTSSQAQQLNKVLAWQNVTESLSYGPVEFVGALPNYFSVIFSIVTLDFPVFSASGPLGVWAEVIRWFVSIVLAVFVCYLVLRFIGLFSRNI